MIKKICKLVTILLSIAVTTVWAGDKPLATYTTKFNTGSVNRASNIKKASEAVNGTVVSPGEMFSFNYTVGPSTRARGFKAAKVFFKGTETTGIGGGICQVSSTIYCAALDAGLTVVERHPHSKRVRYVPEDRDAATSYGGIDLKLRNDFAYPIAIFSGISKGVLTVSISTVTE